MREFSFDLKEYKEITGKLILTIPTYRQRLKMIKDCNFKLDNKGEVAVSNETIDSMIALFDAAKPHFKSVDLKCGEIKVKSFDEMEAYAEFDALLTAASTTIMNAGKLGK